VLLLNLKLAHTLRKRRVSGGEAKRTRLLAGNLLESKLWNKMPAYDLRSRRTKVKQRARPALALINMPEFKRPRSNYNKSKES
jgi:hypothetical protein